MSKKVAILQSNYIPWKGYFDLINSVDEFILYDDMQYTRRDWRNRNKIKTQNGLEWLTIPTVVKGKYHQKIRETRVDEHKWPKKHWRSICHAYTNSPYFTDFKDQFEELYLGKAPNLDLLSDINYLFLVSINRILGIETDIRWSSEFDLMNGKSERLLGICKDSGASTYVSGPAAKDYLNEAIFNAEGLGVEWFNYDNYPEYRQNFGDFEHFVTILDLLFNTGPDAKQYMKSFGI